MSFMFLTPSPWSPVVPPPSRLATFPIELIHDIIRQSDVSSLANWSLVSKALLAFAGPLLHETITLSTSQHVIRMLKRLQRNARARKRSSSLPFPFLSSLQRLEIHALPFHEEYLSFLKNTYPSEPLLSNNVVLAVSGSAWNWYSDPEEMMEFWIPTLVLYLLPVRYEELRRRSSRKDVYFSGDVLSCYLEEVKYLHPLDPESDNSEALHRTYMKLSKLASDQIKLDAIARTCETSMLDLSTVLKPLASQEAFMTSIRRVISSMSSASILKDHGGQWNTFKALKKRVKMMMDRLEELSTLSLSTLQDVEALIAGFAPKIEDQNQTLGVSEDVGDLRVEDA
ncbi:hypothetical protein BDY24DRAFT_390465 [Mrakia frigida]|uniref:uncharacterized protein n=1 Tax=Mrakia frigida TaxID=29902 RepID=UPI003FCBEE4D